MGLMDKLADGAERAAREAEKAFDKGKTKVGELQIEMQMDQLARKLGYLVFDFYRGRQVDQAMRQKILDDLSRLEDQLLRVRAQAAAKAQSDEAAGTTPPADSGPAAGSAEAAEAASAPEAAPTESGGATGQEASTAAMAPAEGGTPDSGESAPTS
jgi:hypothetical protein